MILLKANSELKNVFGRMLKAMGENVTWTGNFVVLNNFLILSGNVRSLIFNFDKRKVITNVIELPDKEEDMESVENNEILSNVLNMTLYAFGKWGTIKGLKVEQDYRQLNGLFYAILKDIKVTPGFRDDNFRFYKDNIQITYEEVVQLAMEEGRRRDYKKRGRGFLLFAGSGRKGGQKLRHKYEERLFRRVRKPQRDLCGKLPYGKPFLSFQRPYRQNRRGHTNAFLIQYTERGEAVVSAYR